MYQTVEITKCLFAVTVKAGQAYPQTSINELII